MNSDDQRLIDTHSESPYYRAFVFIVTLSGALYVFQIFPAYDPSILALSPLFVFIAYLFGYIGGMLIIAGWALAKWYDKILSLQVQIVGLILQGTAAAMLAIVILPQGKNASFLGPFMVVIAICHGIQVYRMRNELTVAPMKIRIDRSIGS